MGRPPKPPLPPTPPMQERERNAVLFIESREAANLRTAMGPRLTAAMRQRILNGDVIYNAFKNGFQLTRDGYSFVDGKRSRT
jgi:hypothetical protein